MVRLPDDAPLAARCDQLLKAVERASLHAELAVKELDVIRGSVLIWRSADILAAEKTN